MMLTLGTGKAMLLAGICAQSLRSENCRALQIAQLEYDFVTRVAESESYLQQANVM